MRTQHRASRSTSPIASRTSQLIEALFRKRRCTTRRTGGASRKRAASPGAVQVVEKSAFGVEDLSRRREPPWPGRKRPYRRFGRSRIGGDGPHGRVSETFDLAFRRCEGYGSGAELPSSVRESSFRSPAHGAINDAGCECGGKRADSQANNPNMFRYLPISDEGIDVGFPSASDNRNPMLKRPTANRDVLHHGC